jgi:ATP-binding cassette subfamily F protein 3
MRPLVSARDISKSFGSTNVLQDTTFDIFEKDRIGLVGRNGAGKSTLLRLLTGEERPDIGEISIKPGLQIGFLTQYQTQDSEENVSKNLQSSDYLAGVRLELGKIEGLMTNPDFYTSNEYESTMTRYGELQSELAKFQGEKFVDRAVNLLADLGLEVDLKQRISTLSGGERRKLALAKILVASPDLDLLLLDEPTNHLDIRTIEWLENFLIDYRGSIVIVSHDYYLLDDTVGRVFDMEGCHLKSYVGDYTDYVHQKDAQLTMNTKSFNKYVNETQRNKQIILKLKGRNRFDAQIKSRLKRMAKTKKIADPIIREKTVNFSFKDAGFHSRMVLEAEGLEVGFGDNILFSGANFEIENGEKIGVIGPNGCGKTTLLNVLRGDVQPTSGDLKVSKMIRPGYFDQGHLSLEPDNNLIQELQSIDDTMHEFDAKALLGRFLFRGDMTQQKVKKLSGGEKARLAILKLVISPFSLLLLDEPTNHLDIPSQQVVAAALNSYKGTAFIISHDRYFLDSVANKILRFENNKLEIYTGNYTTYRAQAARSGLLKEEMPDTSTRYVVEKKFTDWATGQRYKPGDVLEISDDDMDRFQSDLKSGRLVRKQ